MDNSAIMKDAQLHVRYQYPKTAQCALLYGVYQKSYDARHQLSLCLIHKGNWHYHARLSTHLRS